MNQLLSLDQNLFYFINSHSNIFFDYFFSLISFLGEYGAIWIIIAILCLIFDKKNGKIVFISILLALILSFLLSDVLIKNLIFRERPYLSLENVHQLGIAWSNSSFVSGHSSSAFAAGIILIYFYPKQKYLILIFILLMIYSRIYLGMHFPLDVIAGSIIGLTSGYIILYLRKIIKFKCKCRIPR